MDVDVEDEEEYQEFRTHKFIERSLESVVQNLLTDR
jgi:hypothetical protein